MSKAERLLIFANLLLYGFLAVFSYAYVDLNLTISSNPLFLNFVGVMQQLGYYQRPQATAIYVSFIIVSFSFFIFNLIWFYKQRLTLRYLIISTALNTSILLFAYPFLSSDVFNYMFDAKIITHYHQNPYTHKPLDFPQDDWIRFMRWVHRYSPYGPVWLLASTIPSVLGFGKFVLTLLTFKIFIAAFHFLNAYLIYKTLQKLNPKLALFGTAFYALNPLFLIEGVANAHNDIVVASFILMPIYFVVQKKLALSFVSQLVGTLIKYIPIVNLPWLLWKAFDKNAEVEKLILLNLLTLTVFTFWFSWVGFSVPFIPKGSTQVQFQPWYLFWTIPLIALIPKQGLIAASILVSIGASLRYIPFLQNGDWSTPGTQQFIQQSIAIGLVLAALVLLFKNPLAKK